MTRFPLPMGFKVSQVSQSPVALGQLAHFNPSHSPLFVTPQKVPETRMVIGFVTPVTPFLAQGRRDAR